MTQPPRKWPRTVPPPRNPVLRDAEEKRLSAGQTQPVNLQPGTGFSQQTALGIGSGSGSGSGGGGGSTTAAPTSGTYVTATDMGAQLPNSRELAAAYPLELDDNGGGSTVVVQTRGGPLSDPGADRILFWDDSDSKVEHLTPGTGLSISGTTLNATATGLDHGGLSGLADDDHTQYALLAGRAGGQHLKGGTASGDDLTLESTNNATKGTIFMGPTIGDNRVTINGTDVEVVVGGTTVPGRLTVADESSSTIGHLNAHKHTDTATSSANMFFIRSRGSEASETVVADGDVIGQIRWAAFDGTDYAQAAQIAADVDGTPGSNDMPGRLRFLTTPDGSQTLAEAMRIDSSQRVGIGEDSPQTLLHVSDGGALTGTFALGSGANLLVHNSSAAGDDAGIHIACGTSGNGFIHFSKSDAPADVTLTAASGGLVVSGPAGIDLTAGSGPVSVLAAGGAFTLTCNTEIRLNENSADCDTIIKGDTDDNLVHVNAGTDSVGISTSAPDHLLDVDGSFGGKVNSLTSNTTLDATHFIIFASVSGGGFTITLPVASTCPGRLYFIKRTDASVNTLTIARSGSDTVDGVTSITIAANTGYIFSNNGTNWFSMSRL